MKEGTRGLFWFVFSATTAVLFGWFYWRAIDLTTPFIMGDDSAQYYLLFYSIVHGDGYRSIWMDGSPPHVKFPFGLPLLFALVSCFSAGGWGAAFLVPVISAVGAIFMVFWLFRSREVPIVAWSIAVLTGTSSLMYLYARSLLSEVPFLFFLIAALFLADRFIRKGRAGVWNPVGMVFFMLGTVFLKTAGICLVIAFMVMLLEKENWRVSKLILGYKIIVGAILIPVLIWTAVCFFWTAAAEDSYGLLLLKYVDPVKGIVGNGSVVGAILTFFKGINALFFYAIPAALTNTKFLSRTLLAGTISTLVAFGWWLSWRKHRSIIEVFCIFYLLGLAVWPWAQSSGIRMVLPVLPLFFYYFFESIRSIALNVSGKKWGTIWMITVLFVFIGTNVWHGPIMSRTGMVKNEAVGMERAFSWIRRETSESALFLSPIPASLYFYTGRRAIFGPPLYALSNDEVKGLFQAKLIDYVFDSDSIFWRREVLNTLRERLALVYDEDGQRIYKVCRAP